MELLYPKHSNKDATHSWAKPATASNNSNLHKSHKPEGSHYGDAQDQTDSRHTVL